MTQAVACILALANLIWLASIGRAQQPAAASPAAAAPADSTSDGAELQPEADSTELSYELTNAYLTKKHPELAPAWEKLKQGDRAGALEILKSAVSKEPTLPPALLLLARYYLEQGNLSRGLFDLDDAIAQHPEDPGGYLTLAGLACFQRRNTEARLLLERAEKPLAAMPDSLPRKKALQVVMHNHWATVYGRYGRWKDARDHLQALLKLEPKNGKARYNLGMVLFELKEGQLAYKEFEKAHQQDKNLPSAPVAVIMYWQRMKDPKNVEASMRHAEEKFGNDLSTRLFLARTCWQQGRADDFKRHVEAGAAAHPTSPEILLLEGELAICNGDRKTAEEKLDAALMADPNYAKAQDDLAKVLIQSSDKAKRARALDLAQKAAQKRPSDRGAIATFGWVLFKSGRRDEAQKAIGIVAQGTVDGDLAYFVAEMLADQGRKEEARKLLEQALQAKPLFVHRPNAEKLLKDIKQ